MAAIMIPSQPKQSIVRREPVAQGPEGQKLFQATEKVWRHWKEPAELVAGVVDEEALSYQSVPLEPAFTVRVKYQFAGKLAPMPYPLGE